MLEEPTFVALEGADGTGKSTLCTILAERLGAREYATPPEKYLESRHNMDANATDSEHYYFYRDGIYDASREITALLQDGGKVVCDRYWLSTYTYHQVMGVDVRVNDFAQVVQPTMTIILSLNDEVQAHRMSSRGLTAGDRRLFDRRQELTMAFYRNALRFNIPFIVIDAQRFSPTQCADIAIASLG